MSDISDSEECVSALDEYAADSNENAADSDENAADSDENAEDSDENAADSGEKETFKFEMDVGEACNTPSILRKKKADEKASTSATPKRRISWHTTLPKRHGKTKPRQKKAASKKDLSDEDDEEFVVKRKAAKPKRKYQKKVKVEIEETPPDVSLSMDVGDEDEELKIDESRTETTGDISSTEIGSKKPRLSSPDANQPDCIFNLEIPNIGSLDDKGRESSTQIIKGLPWYVRIRTETSERTKNIKFLSLYLCCGETSESSVWYADAIADFIVCNRTAAKHVQEKFSYRFRAGMINSGYTSILSWADLTDPGKGFIKNDTLTVEIKVKVLAVRGVRPSPILRDFTQPQPNYSDGTLTIEGKTLHISKQYLALHSPVFDALFFHGFKESSQASVELEDVVYEEFLELLHVLYPSAKPLTATTCPVVLKLAHQFKIKAVLTHVERFLIGNKDIAKATVLRYSDQYNLFDAQHACLTQMTKVEEIKVIQGQRDYVHLSDTMKLLITERQIKLTEDKLKTAA